MFFSVRTTAILLAWLGTCVAQGTRFDVDSIQADLPGPGTAHLQKASPMPGPTAVDLARHRMSESAGSNRPRHPKVNPFRLVSQPKGPIFLEKPPEVPPPTVVGQRMIPEKYENGSIKIEREVRVFSDNSIENHGTYTEYYANGQKFVEGNFVNGAQNGEWKFWYDNGQICKTITYNQGAPEGTTEVFRKDGTRHFVHHFKDGKKDGRWLTYADDGERILAEEHYTAGQPNGVWIVNYPDGKKQTEIHFKDGKRDGKTSEWDEEGNLVKEQHYVAGERHGKWMTRLPNGSRVLEEYRNGEQISRSIEK